MGKTSQEEEKASAKALRPEVVSRKENSVTRYYPINIPKESPKNTARPDILGLSEPQEGWLILRLWQKLGEVLGQGAEDWVAILKPRTSEKNQSKLRITAMLVCIYIVSTHCWPGIGEKVEGHNVTKVVRVRACILAAINKVCSAT